MLQDYDLSYVCALVFLENASWSFFLSSFKTASSPCPCIFRVKTEVQIATFSSIFNAFREACATVNRFACFRLERHCGVLAAVVAFNLKHSFLGRVKSPLSALIEIENRKYVNRKVL
jgi:hypothetical protein